MKNTEKTSDLATRRDYTTWWWMIGVGFLVAITVVLAGNNFVADFLRPSSVMNSEG